MQRKPQNKCCFKIVKPFCSPKRSKYIGHRLPGTTIGFNNTFYSVTGSTVDKYTVLVCELTQNPKNSLHNLNHARTEGLQNNQQMTLGALDPNAAGTSQTSKFWELKNDECEETRAKDDPMFLQQH